MVPRSSIKPNIRILWEALKKYRSLALLQIYWSRLPSSELKAYVFLKLPRIFLRVAFGGQITQSKDSYDNGCLVCDLTSLYPLKTSLKRLNIKYIILRFLLTGIVGKNLKKKIVKRQIIVSSLQSSAKKRYKSNLGWMFRFSPFLLIPTKCFKIMAS